MRMAQSNPMAGTLHVGTSGYAYPEWTGPFYPPGYGSRRMLPYYAERFGTVEINYTFRRQPAERTLEAWRDLTPEGFLFAVKAHRRITHARRLKDASEPVTSFLDGLRILGPRLGPVLFQTPPNMKFDHARLVDFLACLPPGQQFAFEFRHPSWELAREVLEGRGFAQCVAETDAQPYLQDSLPTGPFVYLRLRRERYGRIRLARWAERIGTALDQGTDVFCYFKHEDKGAGPVFAERLARILARR
jgi:uncharacterized protein YecE (DUF72 family)